MVIRDDPRRDISAELTYSVSFCKKIVKHLDTDGTIYIEYRFEEISMLKAEFEMKIFDCQISAECKDAIISDIKMCALPADREINCVIETVARNNLGVKLMITPPLKRGENPISMGISYIVSKGTCMFLEDFPKFYPGDSSNLEDSSVTARRLYGQISISVNFLPNYPVDPKGKFILMGHEHDLGPQEFSYDRDTDSAKLVKTGPRIAEGKYVVQWIPPRRELFGRR